MFARTLAKAKLPEPFQRVGSGWGVGTNRLATLRSRNLYSANYCGAKPPDRLQLTEAVSTDPRVPDAKIDAGISCSSRRTPAPIQGLRHSHAESADDIFPARSVIWARPNSTKHATCRRPADLVVKIRPYVRNCHCVGISEWRLATGKSASWSACRGYICGGAKPRPPSKNATSKSANATRRKRADVFRYLQSRRC